MPWPRPTWRSRLAVRSLSFAGTRLGALDPSSGPSPERTERDPVHARGDIDIVIVLDVSHSMLAEDFVIDGKRTNRLEIVKQVTREFIAGRPHDRIGMVILLLNPMCFPPHLGPAIGWRADYRITAGMIEDGTAIGTALTAALNRLHVLLRPKVKWSSS